MINVQCKKRIIYMQFFRQVLATDTHIQTHTHRNKHLYKLTHTHTCINIFTQTYTHTHTHTHTHRHGLNLLICTHYGLFTFTHHNTHTQCVRSGQRSNRNSSSLSGYSKSAWDKHNYTPEY